MNIEILNAKEIKNVINRLAYELIEKEKDLKNVAFIGIRSRGDIIAERLQKVIKESDGTNVDMGILDITFYRDDLNRKSQMPEVKETSIDFDIEDREIIIVDDVLFTGRTIRAALDAVFDYGRPARIKLLVLLDRGGRELPIAPDYVGIEIKTKANDVISVRLDERGVKDSIFLEER